MPAFQARMPFEAWRPLPTIAEPRAQRSAEPPVRASGSASQRRAIEIPFERAVRKADGDKRAHSSTESGGHGTRQHDRRPPAMYL